MSQPQHSQPWQAAARVRLARFTQAAESARLAANSAADALTSVSIDLQKAANRLADLQRTPIAAGSPVGLIESQISACCAEIEVLTAVKAEASLQAGELARLSRAASALARSATEAFNKAAGLGSQTTFKG